MSSVRQGRKHTLHLFKPQISFTFAELDKKVQRAFIISYLYCLWDISTRCMSAQRKHDRALIRISNSRSNHTVAFQLFDDNIAT